MRERKALRVLSIAAQGRFSYSDTGRDAGLLFIVFVSMHSILFDQTVQYQNNDHKIMDCIKTCITSPYHNLDSSVSTGPPDLCAV